MSSVAIEITDWFPAPIRLPPNAQEFAIGDVHGHATLLAALLRAMDDEATPAAHLTLLGDLIDRGPESLEALRLAADRGRTMRIGQRTLLLGNHEIMMLLALSDRADSADIADLWVGNGGWTTLGEAGLNRSRLALRPTDIAARFEAAVGETTMTAVREAPLWRESGNLLFVHAGIDPDAPLATTLGKRRLDAGDPDHPAWIRDRFLDHAGAFEGDRIVVHGHTPEVRVLDSKGRDPIPGLHRLDGWRLGLDGGSYGTGIVAGAEFRAGAYRAFTAKARALPWTRQGPEALGSL